MAAMRAGGRDSESYLAGWRRGVGQEAIGDPASVASSTSEQLEAEYPQSRLMALIAGGGHEGSVQ